MQAQPPPSKVPQIPPPSDVAQAPASAIRTVDADGKRFVSSRVVTPGTGATHPGPHDAVTVKYTLWTRDGTTIDASALRGEPSHWTVHELMPGLRLGLPLMVTGETRRFWIPEDLSYDWAHSPLVFDIELLAIDAVSDAPTDAELLAPPSDALRTAKGVAYRVLRSSAGTERPKPFSTVTIHYTGWAARSVFDDSVVRGEPLVVAVDTVMPGLSDALLRMAVGEKTRYWIPAPLAYTPPGPPNSALMIDVELLAIQRASPGQPGTVEVRTNSPDAPYDLIAPDGTVVPSKGPRTVEQAAPGRYRVKPAAMRSYACGVLSSSGDHVLPPSGRLTITITYRPIIV